MYLGRFLLGDYVPLVLLAKNTAQTPTALTAFPTAKIYNQSGSLIETVSLPLWDSLASTGLFRKLLRLGSLYAAGKYDAVILWTISATVRGDLCRFEIQGGNTDGSTFSMSPFNSPNSRWLVGQSDAGNLKAYRNPRL